MLMDRVLSRLPEVLVFLSSAVPLIIFAVTWKWELIYKYFPLAVLNFGMLTPTPSLLEIAYAVAMSLKGHFFRLAFFFLFFFSRIKYFQPGLSRISLRLSWWSLFVCRLLKRGHIVPKRQVYFRENLWDKIWGYWWLNPKVSAKVQSDTLHIFQRAR